MMLLMLPQTGELVICQGHADDDGDLDEDGEVTAVEEDEEEVSEALSALLDRDDEVLARRKDVRRLRVEKRDAMAWKRDECILVSFYGWMCLRCTRRQ
jgi:hypothetical protein